jgi:hypothetical protein
VRTPRSLRVSGKLPRLAIYAAIVQGHSIFIYLRGWFALMRGDCFRGANPLAAKPSVTSKLPPLGHSPGFCAFISGGPTLPALTLGAVTNNPLTIAYSVFNLLAGRVSDVLLPTTLPSGVTFQSFVPVPHRTGRQLEFSRVFPPLLSSAAITREGAKVC